MRLGYKCGLAVVAAALASPVSAQIISTSVPKGLDGGAADKSVAFHVMASPFAKWKYGEVYLDPNDVFGTISGTPNSDFMVAAEAAFGNSDGLNYAVGGWYNKIGTNTFEFDGFDVTGAVNFASLTADLETELTVYEGHAGIFYKSIGLQVGMVRTSGDFTTGTVTSFGGVATPLGGTFTLDVPKANTTDWDAFVVYKGSPGGESAGRLSLALGAGLYRKAGEDESPLREAEAKTVFTGFVTGSASVFKGLSVDASFWYIGKTDAASNLGQEFGSDSQTRLTLGVGYTF